MDVVWKLENLLAERASFNDSFGDTTRLESEVYSMRCGHNNADLAKQRRS